MAWSCFFGIGYDDPVEKAQAVLEEVIGRHPLILDELVPKTQISEIADSSVAYTVLPWVRTGDCWTVYWAL